MRSLIVSFIFLLAALAPASAQGLRFEKELNAIMQAVDRADVAQLRTAGSSWFRSHVSEGAIVRFFELRPKFKELTPLFSRTGATSAYTVVRYRIEGDGYARGGGFEVVFWALEEGEWRFHSFPVGAGSLAPDFLDFVSAHE